MGVRLLPSGRFEGRVMVGGIRYTRTFGSEAEAEAYCKAARGRGKQVATSAPTLATYAPDWITYRETHGLLRDADSEWMLLRVVVREWPRADDPLRSIKRKHVADYVNTLARAGELSRQSIKHRLRLIKRALDAAADEGKVSANAAEGVRVPRMLRKEAGDKWTWLDADEIAAVCNVEGRTEYETLRQRTLWTVAAYTGLRRSELWHLTWSNVLLEGDRPCLRVRAPLKTAAARRDVPLLAPALEALRAWERERKTLHVWPSPSGGRRRKDDDAGWRDHWGYRDGERVIRRAGVLRRVGIERHARFHDLRHTCASHLVQGTWGVELSLLEVGQWLGHSSPTVTIRYAHLSPDALAGKVANIGHGFGHAKQVLKNDE